MSLEIAFEHPEYLKQILNELFGNGYEDILDNIKQVVRGGSTNSQTERVLTVLNTKELEVDV